MPGFPLYHRITWLAILFSVEAVALSTWLDTESIKGAGLAALVGDWGPPLVRSLIALAAVFTGLSLLKYQLKLRGLSATFGPTPIDLRFLAGHLLAMAAVCGLSACLFARVVPGSRADLLAAAWLIAGGIAIGSGAFAFVPPRLFRGLLRATGNTWVYATIAAISVNAAAGAADQLWNPAARLTFYIVRWCMQPFVQNLIADPARRMIGTANFRVIINAQCSGLEGVGLMLLFGLFWLWFLREELRFPRALVVLPAGMLTAYLLNILRIAVLILIGNAGQRSVAAGGFHSQAGWIAFNTMALVLLTTVRRMPWLTRAAPPHAHRAAEQNSAMPYLLPMLMILAAGMISRAVSGKFEWLYPLRFFAAAVTLWVFRRRYAALDWRVGWFAPAIGGLFAVVWVVLHRLSTVPPDNGIGAGLNAAGPAAVAVWVVCRILAAVVTVPIAEELAFRGFLIRRVLSPDFETLGMKSATPLAIAVSSIAFGAMHGRDWIAGTLGGVIYAAVLVRRGRIGDVVAAHATTNLLLAAWVLVYRDWSLW